MTCRHFEQQYQLIVYPAPGVCILGAGHWTCYLIFEWTPTSLKLFLVTFCLDLYLLKLELYERYRVQILRHSVSEVVVL